MAAPWFQEPPDNSTDLRRQARDRADQRLIDALAERQAERRGERRKRLKPSDVVVRAAVAEVLRPFENSRGGHYTQTAEQVAERVYNGCPATMGFLQKAAVNPAMTTVPGWASELIETSVADFLRDTATPSAFSQLADLAL